MLQDVTDLAVYRESLRLLKPLNNFLLKVPRIKFDSIIQSKKCGKSIPANIAEGWAKRSSEAEFKRFLKIALGSSDELITHLRTIVIATPILLEDAKNIALEYKLLSKRINALHKAWKTNKQSV